MMGVSANRTDFRPGPGTASSTTGVLETAWYSSEKTSVTSKVAFFAGSSQQGKARRASVGSNWVVAR